MQTTCNTSCQRAPALHKPVLIGEASGRLQRRVHSPPASPTCHLQMGPSPRGERSPVYVVNDIWSPLCTRFLRCAIVLQNAFVRVFCAQVQCAGCTLRNRQTHQQRSDLLSVPRVKKRGFCHCSAASGNIRMVHCEERNKKSSAQTTSRIKVSFWDCTFLREGHNTSFLQHTGHSNSGVLLYQAE